MNPEELQGAPLAAVIRTAQTLARALSALRHDVHEQMAETLDIDPMQLSQMLQLVLSYQLAAPVGVPQGHAPEEIGALVDAPILS